MRSRFQQFMAGRYGNDALNRTLSISALVCITLNLIFSMLNLGIIGSVFYGVGLALLTFSIFRMFSRNTQRRYAENVAYYTLTNNLRSKMRTRRVRFAQRDMYRYYKCPNCRQQLRVPRGKGKIQVTCPKCHTSFMKKS